ncbi:HD family phosphohydrolase [Blattabacterium cuenoti]|uniref:HD family phosphohydrolase n=1 Tax=Blattabacterium cuenoti TaxID=1653831 RepID=UPI00163C48E8|nr:HDIG domain-containing metalloprotein [Blattabacterium cuenoti]
MNNFFKFNTYKNFINKILIPVSAILLLTFFFPKKKVFEYKFYKNEIWNYETFFCPFNFSITKSNKDLKDEIKKIRKNSKILCIRNEQIEKLTKKKLKKILFIKTKKYDYKTYLRIVKKIYKNGYVDNTKFPKEKVISVIYFKKNDNLISVPHKKIYTKNKVNKLIENSFFYNKHAKIILKNIIIPNIIYDENSTKFLIKKKIQSINKIKFSFKKGDKIIGKNEIINQKLFDILYNFKNIYENEKCNKNKEYYGSCIGYFLIISMIFFIFMLYMFYFQNEIFKNNRKLNFLVISIFLLSITTIFTIRYYSNILYIIPFCILPISIRVFFNFHLSFIIHLTIILLLSIVTPNSFEFTFLQTTTGFLVMLTKKNISKMENLFIAVGKIIITYIITFISLHLIRIGTLNSISFYTISLFFISGILTLFVHPLIFLFEKMLNITSDISLLELSDTNKPILRSLSKKAPGTFQHVLTVANLAEEAAVAIGANSLLTKIGGIYHDIGKIKNSIFFTENQYNIENPHEKLTPTESAKIILDHVSYGVELAKKYNLPNTISDFIKTHHGDSLIHYFYRKEQVNSPNFRINKKKFQYSGPKPFSKETTIVMIADSVEAASKSMKNPSYIDLENVVDYIINKQKKENQFSNANITLKEIEKIKMVLKKKLINIYHTRIVYPKQKQ